MSIVLMFFSWVVIFVGSILIMIYGWGLTPVSWGWIIFGHIFTVGMGATLQLAAKQLD